MREAWKRETYVQSQSFSSESAVKCLHVGRRKIQISPPPFIERCIRLNSYEKAVQLLLLLLFLSAYITLLSTTGYKVLYGIYLALQQQRKLIQFLVCSNVGVLSSLEIPPQAWEKHIYKLDFLSLAILVLEYYTARISMHRVLSD